MLRCIIKKISWIRGDEYLEQAISSHILAMHHFSEDMKDAIHARWLANPTCACRHFLWNSQSWHDYLAWCQSKVLKFEGIFFAIDIIRNDKWPTRRWSITIICVGGKKGKEKEKGMYGVLTLSCNVCSSLLTHVRVTWGTQRWLVASPHLQGSKATNNLHQ